MKNGNMRVVWKNGLAHSVSASILMRYGLVERVSMDNFIVRTFRRPSRYYVYFIKTANKVQYIGKGSGRRAVSHFRARINGDQDEIGLIINRAWAAGEHIELFVYFVSDEDTALKIESTMIILEDPPGNNRVGRKSCLKFESVQILELLAHFNNPQVGCSYHIDFTRRINRHQRKRITPRKVARVFNKGKAPRFYQAGFIEAISLPIEDGEEAEEDGEDSEEVIFEERTEELLFNAEDEVVFEERTLAVPVDGQVIFEERTEQLTEDYQKAASWEESLKRRRERYRLAAYAKRGVAGPIRVGRPRMYSDEERVERKKLRKRLSKLNKKN